MPIACASYVRISAAWLGGMHIASGAAEGLLGPRGTIWHGTLYL